MTFKHRRFLPHYSTRQEKKRKERKEERKKRKEGEHIVDLRKEEICIYDWRCLECFLQKETSVLNLKGFIDRTWEERVG